MLSRRDFTLGLAASTLLGAGSARLHLGAQTNAYIIADFDGLLGVLAKLQKYGFAGFETGFRNLESQFDKPVPARDAINAPACGFSPSTSGCRRTIRRPRLRLPICTVKLLWARPNWARKI